VQRRPDQGDLLPHAFGEGAQPPVAGVGELEDLEQVVDAAAPHRGLDVVDGAEVVQVGASRHPLIEAGDLGHESDPGSNRSRIVPGVDAVDFDRARRGQQDARHAAQGGRLSGSVAAEQDQALPFLDIDGEVLEGKHVAVALGKAFNFQHG